MKIIFTTHSKKRMVERGILSKQVFETIDFPDYKVTKGDKFEVYKEFGDKVLKVIFVKESKFIKVITFVWK